MLSLWEVDRSWRKAVGGQRWLWRGRQRSRLCFLTHPETRLVSSGVWTEWAARAKAAQLLTPPFLTS